MNMEDFERYAAYVLNACYEAFPGAVALNFWEVDPSAGDLVNGNFVATVDFLASEGFIRSGDIDMDGVYAQDLCLTAKGLAVLGRVPDTLKVREPLGHQLGTALKSGSKEVLKHVVGEIVRIGVGMVQQGGGFVPPAI